MLKRNLEKKSENNYELCIKCLYCKQIKEKLKCSEGYFNDKKNVYMLTPQEFDCWQYEEV
jgi:hypothetical protein